MVIKHGFSKVRFNLTADEANAIRNHYRYVRRFENRIDAKTRCFVVIALMRSESIYH